jgi:Family of unknown function (DUF6011)
MITNIDLDAHAGSISQELTNAYALCEIYDAAHGTCTTMQLKKADQYLASNPIVELETLSDNTERFIIHTANAIYTTDDQQPSWYANGDCHCSCPYGTNNPGSKKCYHVAVARILRKALFASNLQRLETARILAGHSANGTETPPAVVTATTMASEASGADDLFPSTPQQPRTAPVKTPQEFTDSDRATTVVAPMLPPNATYTVAIGAQYRTLKIEDCPDKFNQAAGTRMISFLSGPDNETNFTGCAFLFDDGHMAMWKRFRSDSFLRETILVLLASGDEKRLEAAEAYAMKSGRCARCARKLTVPASLHRGFGPDCAAQLGI